MSRGKRRSACTHSALLALIAALTVPLSAAGSSLSVTDVVFAGTPAFPSSSNVVNFRDLDSRPAPAFQADVSALPAPEGAPIAAHLKSTSSSPRGGGGTAPDDGPASEAPVIGSSFASLLDNNAVIPPDTNGAVGPAHVVTSLNSQIRITNRLGAPVVADVTQLSFWSSLGVTSAFDPRTLYDPYSGRWIMAAVSDARSAASSVLVGASVTSDPTGAWRIYRFDADPGNTLWADFPQVGFTKDWITVSLNMFTNSFNSFSNMKVFSVNKSSVYTGVSPSATAINVASGFSSSMQPVATYSPTDPTQHIFQHWNGGAGAVRLWRVTGAVGSETLTAGAFVFSPETWTFSVGSDFAPQLGATQKINVIDSRILSAAFRNGSIWGVQNVFLPTGTPTRTAIQWWEIDPGTASTRQRARIDDPSNAKFFYYPSLAVNSNNDVLIGYARSSATQFVSGNYSFRYGGDPPNTMQADAVLKAGEAKYFKTYSGTRNRWGDYSAAAVDPVNDTDLWTVQEFAWVPGGGFDRWGTWWGRVVPNGVPAPAFAPGLLDFGPVRVGTSAPSQAVTITNTGTALLSISSVTIGGTNPADFAKGADTCSGVTLRSGTSCSVSVTFGPLDAGGRQASLNLASNAPGSPHAMTLRGVGTRPLMSLDPAALPFGNRRLGTTSPAQSVAVTNSGTAPMSIGPVSKGGANPADFSISSDSCSNATLAPGGSCSVGATFAPSALGPRAASLVLPNDAPGNPHAVALTGTGVQPAVGLSARTLAFGGQEVATTSASQTLIVTNTGTDGLNVGTPTLSGANPSEFALGSNTCSGVVVAPGETCSIEAAFAPVATGLRTATLSIPSDAPTTPDTVLLDGTGLQARVSLDTTALDFGDQRVDRTSLERSVTITNTGDADLRVGSLSLGGPDAGEYAVATNGCASAVAPGGTCSIGIVFTPAVEGPRAATLIVPSNAPTSPDLVSLSGTGVNPLAGANPTAIDFGVVRVGAGEERSVSVTNVGTGILKVGPAELSGAEAADYAIVEDGCLGAALAAGASCSLRLRFSPAANDVRAGTLSIPHDASQGSPLVVPLNGTGDATPPETVITSTGPVLIGLLGDVLAGTATDNIAGVDFVRVTYEPLLPIAEPFTTDATLTCATPTSCTWTAPLPGTPGAYFVTSAGTDSVGNVEEPGEPILLVTA